MADQWWCDDTLRPPGTEDDDVTAPVAINSAAKTVRDGVSLTNTGDACPPETEDANASLVLFPIVFIFVLSFCFLFFISQLTMQ